MVSPATCSFCHRRLDEVSHLVRADGIFICLACARRCVLICEAENAAPVARFPRAAAAPPQGPGDRHLQSFLHYARGGITTGTPEPLLPWLREFLDVYELAILDAAKDTAGDGDSLVRANRVSRAFDAMMLPYRGDRRRAYLGAVFDRLLGRSIREGFSYHVDMTVLAPAEGESL
jgi:hypothetical protein